MIAETKIAPPNSLLLVMDRDGGEIPESMGGALVVATASCIAVGTRSAADGETCLVLADERAAVSALPGLRKVFAGTLATPNRLVRVSTVLLATVVELPVLATLSDIEIWADDGNEPNKVCVVVVA